MKEAVGWSLVKSQEARLPRGPLPVHWLVTLDSDARAVDVNSRKPVL